MIETTCPPYSIADTVTTAPPLTKQQERLELKFNATHNLLTKDERPPYHPILIFISYLRLNYLHNKAIKEKHPHADEIDEMFKSAYLHLFGN